MDNEQWIITSLTIDNEQWIIGEAFNLGGINYQLSIGKNTEKKYSM